MSEEKVWRLEVPLFFLTGRSGTMWRDTVRGRGRVWWCIEAHPVSGGRGSSTGARPSGRARCPQRTACGRARSPSAPPPGGARRPAEPVGRAPRTRRLRQHYLNLEKPKSRLVLLGHRLPLSAQTCRALHHGPCPFHVPLRLGESNTIFAKSGVPSAFIGKDVILKSFVVLSGSRPRT